jgi:peptidoglycan/LPS O-acetylase OafA/YrhL
LQNTLCFKVICVNIVGGKGVYERMQKLATRLGRAALMGIGWAAAWLLPSLIGGSIRVGEVEPEHIGWALAGFPSGFLFAFFSGIASGRRRLGDLSIAHAAACGAVSGAIIGMLPFVIGDQHNPGGRPLWILPVVVTGSMAALCAVSAVVSLPIARRFGRQNQSAATGLSESNF